MKTLKYLKNVVTLALDQQKCIGCGGCVAVCPHAVFAVADHKAVIVDRDSCMECGACMMNCPAGAITVKAGVGCAAGVIRGMLQGTEPTCDCGKGSCC
jgi:NAD-dependent dihydropyrimidine dehydrogenase PreA subunit